MVLLPANADAAIFLSCPNLCLRNAGFFVTRAACLPPLIDQKSHNNKRVSQYPSARPTPSLGEAGLFGIPERLLLLFGAQASLSHLIRTGAY